MANVDTLLRLTAERRWGTKILIAFSQSSGGGDDEGGAAERAWRVGDVAARRGPGPGGGAGRSRGRHPRRERQRRGLQGPARQRRLQQPQASAYFGARFFGRGQRA